MRTEKKHLPPYPGVDPWVWIHDATPDGFAEITLQVRDVILHTWVVGPDDEFPDLRKQIQQVLARRC